MTNYFGAISGVIQESSGAVVLAKWWPTEDVPLSAYIIGASEEAIIPTLGDDSGNGNNLESNTYSHDPIFVYGFDGYEPCAFFDRTDGTENLKNSNVSYFNHLHQGAHSFVLRVRVGDSTTYNNHVIFTTRSGGNNGIVLKWFHLISPAGGRLNIFETNSGSTVLNLTSDPHTLDDFEIANIVYRVDMTKSPQAELWLNGDLVASGNYTGSQSSSDCTGGLEIGLNDANNSDGFSPIKMQFKAFASYNRWLTDEEKDLWFSGSYENGSQRVDKTICFFGDSITVTTYNYRKWLWRRIAQTPNLRLKPGGAFTSAINQEFPLGNKSHDGVGGQHLETIRSRIDSFAAANPGFKYQYGVLLGGTNNLPSGASAAIAELPATIDSMLEIAETVLVCTIPYGLGGVVTYTEAGDAGTYNAAIPGIVSSKGSRVVLVDIHQGPDAYVPATDAADNTGHTADPGADCIGTHIANAIIALES